jgi:hypothetical protein
MPTIKYLYLDDEEPTRLSPFIDAITGGTNQIQNQNQIQIQIVPEHPNSFDFQIEHLMKVLNEYDGLLLDWRLDKIPNSEGKQATFRAAALAQEIRTGATEGEYRDLPIVLWSTYENLRASYYGDDTSHDLFDYKHDKDKIGDSADAVRKQLLSLAEGYKRIRASEGAMKKMLALEDEIYNKLDPGFTQHFLSDKSVPAHEYARFILKEAILRPGLLISEALLAARLGVDAESSSDWQALLQELPTGSKYQGVFHEAWPRWWSYMIEEWWRSLAPKKLRPISILPAGKRVELLKRFTELEKLVAATPIKESYGNRFQTLCTHHHKPLDLTDGVFIFEAEPEPWQERRYISLDVALSLRGEAENLRPHPIEMEYLREIKESYSKDGEES